MSTHTLTLERAPQGIPVGSGEDYFQPHWYAAYTCARHEKRVADNWDGYGVEFYLPLYEVISRWKDRKVRLSLPLFPGYIFVRIPLSERLRVLQTPGVVRLVGWNGRPREVEETEIDKLRRGLEASQAEPHPFLTTGRRVRVLWGPFEGCEGILKRRRGSLRVVLSMELIQRSICVEVDADALRPA